MCQIKELQKLADDTAYHLEVYWSASLRNMRRRYNEGTPEYFKIWEKSEDFVMQTIGVRESHKGV